MKFPSILTLIWVNNDKSLEKLVIQKLSQSEAISMKYLYLWFAEKYNSVETHCFINFLKHSKIKFLSFYCLKYTVGFDSQEFCDFLKNLLYLL